MALSAELDALHATLSCCTYRGDQHTHVLIEEHDDLASLKKVTLDLPNGDWFSFDPDRGRAVGKKERLMSPLLSVGKAHDHHRACDCVVLVRYSNKLTALYIDLKSGNPSGYAGQFKSTRQFVRYALGLLEEFRDEKKRSHKLNLDKERFVVLHGGKPTLINKTTTVPKIQKLQENSPNNPHRLRVNNAAHLKLKQFLE
jgi:hypothetical protein